MTITAERRLAPVSPDEAQPTTGWIVDTSTFGARLALVRNHMKWNVKEAARECGQAAATWRLWEMEGALPRDRVHTAKIIATRTGCDFRWLVHGPDRGDGDLPVGVTTKYPQPQPPTREPLAPHLVATVGHPHPGQLANIHAVRVQRRHLSQAGV